MPLSVTPVATTPFEGQKPGTSGLRQKTRTYLQEHYLENFVQSVFNTTAEQGGIPKKLVVSGDGRFHNDVALQVILKMAAANGVKHVLVGEKCLLSTPAVSAVIRKHGADGGFILSASHNPGGIDEDFGLKYNLKNGGPALEGFTNAIFEHTKNIAEYKTSDLPAVDVSTAGAKSSYDVAGKPFEVEVLSSTADHVELMADSFDIDAIRALVSHADFSMAFDSMGGVQGPYAKEVFHQILGVQRLTLLNCDPRPDFGGPESSHHGHADPNLAHAGALLKVAGLEPGTGKAAAGGESGCFFGAAADGDADRNMIVGRQCFVAPSDSLAIIAHYGAMGALPGFAKRGGLKSVARSMPTSSAVDNVAEKHGLKLFETPTGWKFFGNLMDEPGLTPLLCGEESFGTGSDHIREKDGLWAVMAWLQILAHEFKAEGRLVSVKEVCDKFYAQYGRYYYARYDFEGVDKATAQTMMDEMEAALTGASYPTALSGLCGGRALPVLADTQLQNGDMFAYEDPVDKSVSQNQGIRLFLADGSRIIFRLSGTGVVGATIRLYLEKYAGPEDSGRDPFEAVEDLGAVAAVFADIKGRFAREKPDVVT